MKKFAHWSGFLASGYFVLAACAPAVSGQPPQASGAGPGSTDASASGTPAFSRMQREGIADCDTVFQDETNRGVPYDERERNRTGCYWDATTI